MHYVSTRGQAPRLDFTDALLAGLASDGGLYVPEIWPQIDAAEIASFAGRPYAEVAARVLHAFAPEMDRDALRATCDEVYGAFAHPATAPLVQIGPEHFVLELFRGPTLAFKDFAMRMLARMMDDALKARGRRATILAATSGDTGAAAQDAFKGLDAIDVVTLFPYGRVSEVQRRQMTGVDADNVHAVAIDGTFDDCQDIVKALFARDDFRERVRLSAVNSINWARIAAQTVYYFTAATSLGAPHRPVAFSVPTGNFGDVFAGYAAARMGLPIARLMVATNVNDILARCLETGIYEARGVVATQSPSMDIQVSSNFERLIFETHGRDAGAVVRLMEQFRSKRRFAIEEPALSRICALFAASRTDEDATRAAIQRVHEETGYLIDPHTAVGVAAAEADPSLNGHPVVTLGTAHPAKFPDAVEAACGMRPELPPHLADLLDRPERMIRMGNDPDAVANYVMAKSREAQSREARSRNATAAA